MTKTDVHIGNNIRLIRRIKGMKQSVLADTLGITQQSVSKMEKKKNLTDEQIAEAAKVLQTTVEAIKDLNEERIIQNNFLNEQAGYINQKINPIEKIVELYERLLESKDNELRALRDEISALKTTPSNTNDNVKNINRKAD